MVQLLLKHTEKLIKYLFHHFFPIYKKFQLYIIKKTKESLQKKPCERYQNLSEEDKNKKRKYGREQCRNPPEEKKIQLSIEKKYSKIQKRKSGSFLY